MSTLAYAQLTNAREASKPGTSTTQKPGIQTYMDAFAALVPAEVLTLHGLIITATMGIPKASADATASSVQSVAQILPDGLGVLQWSFWGLVVCAVALYAIPRIVQGKWDRFDWARVLIAPLAFVGWTMLQRATAFDAVAPAMSAPARTAVALFLGAVLGAAAAALALKADAKPAP